MPAYKDEKKGTWTVAFYYRDWTGERKKKYKRGFKTKRDAAEYESEFKLGASGDMDMTMESFMKVYFRDKQGELKERSMTSKKYMMDAHIVPYFKGRKLNAITPADIIKWQNAIRDKGYSQTYLRMIQNQLTALFTHAHNIYDLSNNPCKKVKKMGKADGEKVDFWTYDEYERFIGTMDEDSRHYVIFETLFWTGCRIGELLALTKNDIDFNNNQIHISKTYYRHNCNKVKTSNEMPEKPKMSAMANKYKRLSGIHGKLVSQNKAIYKQEKIFKAKETELKNCKSLFKGKERRELQEQINQLQTRIDSMKKRIPTIVKGHGYANVKEFLKEYQAVKAEYGDYRKAVRAWEDKHIVDEEQVSMRGRLDKNKAIVKMNINKSNIAKNSRGAR